MTAMENVAFIDDLPIKTDSPVRKLLVYQRVTVNRMSSGWWYTKTPLKNMSSSMGRITSHV